MNDDEKNNEPKIKIPDPQELIKKLQDQFGWLFTLVIGALLIGFITMLFMVATLFIDTWQYRATVSREKEQLKLQEAYIRQAVEIQGAMFESLREIKYRIEDLNTPRPYFVPTR